MCGGGSDFVLSNRRVTYHSHDTWTCPQLFSKKLLLLMLKVTFILSKRLVIRDTYGTWLLDQVEEEGSQCIER